MTEAEILTMTKSNLALLTSAHDAYLAHLITAASSMIAREGITLDTSKIEDCNLIVM